MAAFGLRLALVSVLIAVSSCSLGRIDSRMAYWDSETHAHLAKGTSLADAQAFFRARGTNLLCCVSGPIGASQFQSAVERRVGRFFITEYDVAVLVAFDSAERVDFVRVERWGVGL